MMAMRKPAMIPNNGAISRMASVFPVTKKPPHTIIATKQMTATATITSRDQAILRFTAPEAPAAGDP